MNVWPLIQRELQVGARRRSTQWLRVAVAVVATLIGAIYFPIVSRAGGIAPGMGLFTILAWMAFGVTGLFGVFFASDVISSERREGTLGLLFLTRLRGIDVVLGKLFSTSLRAAFSLMAATPVLALPILLGGVTFEAYAHAALVLGNTLFLSVSLGLFVSSFSRNPVRTVLGTLFCAMLLTGATFWIDITLVGFDGNTFEPRLSFASPAYILYQGILGSSEKMWIGLGIQHAFAWLLLSVAAWKTGRHSEKIRTEAGSRAWRRLSSTKHLRASRKLRSEHPVRWLASQHSRGPTIAAISVWALVGVVGIFHFQSGSEDFWQQISSSIISGITGLFAFVLFIWITFDAVRRIGDSRTSGALELLMATPLTDREILSGFVHGTMRVFRFAVIALILLLLVNHWLSIITWMRIMVTQPSPISMQPFLISQGVSGVFSLLNTISLCGAIIWVGTWLGLRSERTVFAAGMTYAVVVILPAIVIGVASMLLSLALQFGIGNSTAWVSPTISGTARLVVNVSFIIWARWQCTKYFRDAANGTFRRKPFRKKSTPPPLSV